MMWLDGRRLVRALVLGVLVLLLVGGGTGFAMAASDGPSGDALVIPKPGPGDRATYTGRTITLDAATARPMDGTAELTVEWLPAFVTSDVGFVLREVHPVRVSLLWAEGTAAEGFYVHETAYDAVTGAAVVETVNGTSWTDDDWNYGLVVDDALGSPPERLDYLHEMYAGTLGDCGLRVPFQGQAYNGKPFRLDAACGWDGQGFTYRSEGWSGRRGERAYHFSAVEDPRFRLSYDDTSPLPARFHTTLADLFGSYAVGRHFEFERVDAERSGAHYPVPGQPLPLGDVRRVAPTPWLVDDADLGHEFRLAEAFAAAMAEPDMPLASSATTVAEFYAANPDTYVAVAMFQYVADRQGGLHPNWWLAFTDGHDVLAKRVERAPPAVDNVYLPSQAGTRDTVYAWNAEDDVVPPVADGIFPPIGLLPDAVPFVPDVMARYETLTGIPATGYGHDVRCDDPACSRATLHVAAGESRADIETSVNTLGNPVLADRAVFDHLWVDEGGNLVSRVAFRNSHEARLELVPSSVGDDGPNSRSTLAAVSGAWVLPPGAAVAGLSFLALVASALYYFWPALKGAASVGLFSRIEDGQVLEHATRRRIHDVIGSEPGIHFQALARTAGVGRGALDHHLRKLVAADLVTVRKAPGYTCYFQKGKLDRHLLDAAPALRSNGSRAVLQAVVAKPGASSRDLAAHLGIAPSTMSYHLKRLETAGLVVPGEKSGVRVTPLGAQAAA